jgi:diaminohydroxyphosphoribosylaminopyrimidine deaminase/5-amino-6-(5-phosphoribosylamino)uracil reductase
VSQFDEELMARAIAVAKQGDPSPNPHVGCVIARVTDSSNEVVAEGHHQTAGQAHAETVALNAAGDRARGATAYVTLEPCNHDGRTPPCVDALIAAGISRVAIGCRDPNPNVAGGGIERLKAAGIEVTLGVCEQAARDLIEPWAKFITNGTSYLSLKLALSLDGRIATKTGESKWITSREARAYGHQLRARHDAVMVGINTILADDPKLTVRAAVGHSPVRLIADSKLRIPMDRHVVTTASEVSTCVITTDQADPEKRILLEAAGVQIILVPATSEGRCDMKAVLRELAKREVVSVLCEGGAELAGSLLQAQLVDRLYAFLAPLLLGPRGRAGAVDWAGPETLAAAPRIADPNWEVHGPDAYVSGRLIYGS